MKIMKRLKDIFYGKKEGGMKERIVLLEAQIRFMRSYEHVLTYELFNFFENILNSAKKGEIEYFSSQQIERIEELLNKANPRHSTDSPEFGYFEQSIALENLLYYYELVLCKEDADSLFNEDARRSLSYNSQYYIRYSAELEKAQGQPGKRALEGAK